MAVQLDVYWPTCDQDGCIGIRLDAGDKCLAHAEDEELDAALEQQVGLGDGVGLGVDLLTVKVRGDLFTVLRLANAGASLRRQ